MQQPVCTQLDSAAAAWMKTITSVAAAAVHSCCPHRFVNRTVAKLHKRPALQQQAANKPTAGSQSASLHKQTNLQQSSSIAVH
jgi:heme exporter protein D